MSCRPAGLRGAQGGGRAPVPARPGDRALGRGHDAGSGSRRPCAAKSPSAGREIPERRFLALPRGRPPRTRAARCPDGLRARAHRTAARRHRRVPVRGRQRRRPARLRAHRAAAPGRAKFPAWRVHAIDT
jgi:hypothetical protein